MVTDLWCVLIYSLVYVFMVNYDSVAVCFLHVLREIESLEISGKAF